MFPPIPYFYNKLPWSDSRTSRFMETMDLEQLAAAQMPDGSKETSHTGYHPDMCPDVGWPSWISSTHRKKDISVLFRYKPSQKKDFGSRSRRR